MLSMTAVTLQVQLCEYRQFRHSLARLKYGLPDDETMRGECEKDIRLEPENFIEYDGKRKCVTFEFPKEDKKISFDVPAGAVGNCKMVAARVAAMCFSKFREGLGKEEVTRFRDEVLKGYCRGEDVPESSEAWGECKIQLSHSSPVVSFQANTRSGSKIPFQTTKAAAGGILEAERIARLCWEKFRKGSTKDNVIEFRNNLYRKRGIDISPGLRPTIKKTKM